MIVTLPFSPGVTSSVFPDSRFSSYWYSVLNGFSTTFVTGFVPILTISLTGFFVVTSSVYSLLANSPFVNFWVTVCSALPFTPFRVTFCVPASIESSYLISLSNGIVFSILWVNSPVKSFVPTIIFCFAGVTTTFSSVLTLPVSGSYLLTIFLSTLPGVNSPLFTVPLYKVLSSTYSTSTFTSSL